MAPSPDADNRVMQATNGSGVHGEPRPAANVYDVVEHSPAEIPLGDLVDADGRLRLDPKVEAKKYFTLHLVKDRVRLQARGYVGLIPLNDRVVINVVPRVPVKNFARLLSVSQNVPTLVLAERGYRLGGEWTESLLDLYARGLIERVETIASSGLIREYRRLERDTAFPRGRILLASTCSHLWPRGQTYKVRSAWYERTADVAPNRCVKFALWYLADHLSLLGTPTASRRRILDRMSALYELFRGVSLDYSLGFLHDPVVRGARALPSLRRYYRPALDISLAIVMEQAVEFEGNRSGIQLPSFVLNMSQIFEDYLRAVLRRHAVSKQWNAEVLDGNVDGRKGLFDQESSDMATPDIVVRRGDQRHSLVIEVKNIPVKGNSPREALEQAITYAVSYRCNKVVLVHPRAHNQEFTGLRLQGTIDDLHVYQYVFDLASDSLAKEDWRFVTEMEKLAGAIPPGG